jgi:hypothetical protein
MSNHIQWGERDRPPKFAVSDTVSPYAVPFGGKIKPEPGIPRHPAAHRGTNWEYRDVLHGVRGRGIRDLHPLQPGIASTEPIIRDIPGRPAPVPRTLPTLPTPQPPATERRPLSPRCRPSPQITTDNTLCPNIAHISPRDPDFFQNQNICTPGVLPPLQRDWTRPFQIAVFRGSSGDFEGEMPPTTPHERRPTIT